VRAEEIRQGTAKRASTSSQFEYLDTLALQRQRGYWQSSAHAEAQCLAPMVEYKKIFIHGYFFT
jgi:hypothetical protein